MGAKDQELPTSMRRRLANSSLSRDQPKAPVPQTLSPGEESLPWVRAGAQLPGLHQGMAEHCSPGLRHNRLDMADETDVDSSCISAEVDSDSDSVFIYAEGIRMCESSRCSTLEACDSLCLWTDTTPPPALCLDTQRAAQPGFDSLYSGCDSSHAYSDGEKGFDVFVSSLGEFSLNCPCNSIQGNSSIGNLCLYTDPDAEISSDSLGDSTEAVFGSDTSSTSSSSSFSCCSVEVDCDSDPASAHTGWQWSFDSPERSLDTSSESLCSSGAEWGTASSVASGSASCSLSSGGSADCDSEHSWCTVDRRSMLDSLRETLEPSCDSQAVNVTRYHDRERYHDAPAVTNLHYTEHNHDAPAVICCPDTERYHDTPAVIRCPDTECYHDTPGVTHCGNANCCFDSLAVPLRCEEGCLSGPSCKPRVGSPPLSGRHRELALREPLGVVSSSDRHHVPSFFRTLVREAVSEGEEESRPVNEGFLFHPQQMLQSQNLEYREGQEYCLLHHIQSGSYGDVFSIRDKRTGFTCAAKKIPLGSFSWEEVGCWSALDSPRVLRLFGAVREGPNVVLFMDLKTVSLAQVLRVRGHLPELLALYYQVQVLEALAHLHTRRVLHLDVKVDNVLLSKDGKDCFLCDFGLSDLLDHSGHSTKAFRGSGLRGTQSHMAPEVVRGDRRCAKADVWSSCCMLLHMLNGHQPWTRCYKHPLYLKIVNEPPPVWEIPWDCDPLTSEVIRAGLVKDTRDRASAKELREKTVTALTSVGGISCAIKLARENSVVATMIPEHPTSLQVTSQEIPAPVGTTTGSCSDEVAPPRILWVSSWRERAEEEDATDSEAMDSEEEDGWDECEQMDEEDSERRGEWMERYWGGTDREAVLSDDLQTSSGEESEAIVEGEEEEELVTNLREGLKNPSEENHLTGEETAIESEEENHSEEEKGDSEAGRRYYLGLRAGFSEEDAGDPAGERREVEDDGSEVESLRELRSDWSDEEWEPFQRLQILFGPKAKRGEDDCSSEEGAGTRTRMPGQAPTSSSETCSPQPLICARGQNLSDKDSDWSDDLSSGVFSSFNSLTDEQSFNVDWMVSTNQPPSCCFNGLGVDIWVEDVNGESLRIRERPRVTLGHVAMGVSEQISMQAFSLATLDGKLVSPNTEVLETGMWLQCVPAPDGSPAWDWRIKDGKMELQECDGLISDTCSTLAVQ